MRTPHARIRRTVDAVVAVLMWLFGLPSLLLAHGGGMTREDLGPVAVSAASALIGYWAVILWPKRKKADPDYRGPLKKQRSGPGQWARRARRQDNTFDRLRPLKQVPPLRQVPRAGGYSDGPDSVSNG